jgi:hypothetical protein
MDEILNRIMDSEKWPSISCAENLETLNEMADHSFLNDAFENKLAAMLMYHQIVEGMCIHLLEDCEFFIQLSIHPITIQMRKQENKMLGFYLDELEKNIDFKFKNEFIGKCREFNTNRNRVVHELARIISDETLDKINKTKEKFDAIYYYYDKIQDWFRLIFKDFRKDVFMDYFEEEDLDSDSGKMVHS